MSAEATHENEGSLLVTRSEAMKILRVNSTNTMRRYERQKLLVPCPRGPGDRAPVLYLRSDVEAFALKRLGGTDAEG